MTYYFLKTYLSQPRLQRYLISSRQNPPLAIKNYQKNIQVSSSFYPLLHLFEVILRNVISKEMKLYFNDVNWIYHQTNLFMFHPQLAGTQFYLRKQVLGIIQKLKTQGKVAHCDQIISEQNLGFWISLFDPHHFKLIGGCVLKAFPNKPSNANRKILHKKLNRIRHLRNRIYHNEPICFSGDKISYEHAHQIRIEIFEVFEWINPELNQYIKEFISSMK